MSDVFKRYDWILLCMCHPSICSRSKFGQLGPGKGQFNSPHGFCLGMDEDIVVADTNNHRIQIFEKTGDFKYQFGQPGIHAAVLFSCLIYILLHLSVSDVISK